MGNAFVGAVVGKALNTKIDNVSVWLDGDLIGSGDNVGGLVGWMNTFPASSTSETPSKITNSWAKVEGTISGINTVGGVVGLAEYGTLIDAVAADADVQGNNSVGGVIGNYQPTDDSTLNNLFFAGNIQGLQNVGGLIGATISGVRPCHITLTNSGVRGSVKTTTSGIFGYSPGVFVGNTSSNIAQISYLHDYSAALYQENVDTTATTLATLIPHYGDATTVITDSVYVPADATAQTSPDFIRMPTFNRFRSIPRSWAAILQTEPVKTGSTGWVSVPSIPMNDGFPMPARIFDLDFFGAAAYQCDIGTFSRNGGSPCDLASPGHFVDSIGQKTEEACGAGYFQPNAGASFCIPARVGYYVGSSGATHDTACPAGHLTTFSGAAECPGLQSASYSGPVVSSPASPAHASGEVILPGSNLSGITSVKIDSVAIPFEVRGNSLVLRIPAGITLGVKNLVISSTSGVITVDSALNIIEKPLEFNVAFVRVKNKVTATVTSPSSCVLRLNGKLATSQHGSGTFKNLLKLKKGKNYVDVFVDGVRQKHALFTVR